MRLRLVSPMVVLVCLAAGCAPSERPAKYAWQNEQTALADLAARGRAVKTLSGQASVTLRKPSGDTIHFDAALVAELPGKFRIRAWKFGQAIFDLTVTPEGVWLLRDSRAQREQVWPAGLTPQRFAWGWCTISGQNVDGGEPTLHQERGVFTIVQHLEKGASLTTTVDRDTLTVRQHKLLTAEGTAPLLLQQQEYRYFNGVLWPRRIIATSVRGTITMTFEELEINQPTVAGAFEPPRRAAKLP